MAAPGPADLTQRARTILEVTDQMEAGLRSGRQHMQQAERDFGAAAARIRASLASIAGGPPPPGGGGGGGPAGGFSGALQAMLTSLGNWGSTALGIVGGVASGISKLLSSAFSLPGLIIGGGAVAGLVVWPLELAGNLELAKIGMDTFLHSGQAADAMLSNLQNFAIKTPFRFDALVQLSRQLLGVGFSAKEVIPQLTAIGDVVSAYGGSQDVLNRIVYAFQEMKANTRITGIQLREFMNAGIPALQILADAAGTSTRAMRARIEAGAVSADWAIAKLNAGFEKLAGGSMQRANRSILGLFSNLQDTAEALMRAWGGGLAESIEPTLTRFADWFSLTTPEVKDFQEALHQLGMDAGGWVAQQLTTFGDKVGAAFKDPAFKAAPDFLSKLGVVAEHVVGAGTSTSIGTTVAAVKQFGSELGVIVDVAFRVARTIGRVLDELGKIVKWVNDHPLIARMFGMAPGVIAGGAPAQLIREHLGGALDQATDVNNPNGPFGPFGPGGFGAGVNAFVAAATQLQRVINRLDPNGLLATNPSTGGLGSDSAIAGTFASLGPPTTPGGTPTGAAAGPSVPLTDPSSPEAAAARAKLGHADFFSKYTATAQKWSEKTGLPASFFLAVNASESGWGGAPYNELFGIARPEAAADTFDNSFGVHLRKYASPDAAYASFVDLITDPNGRYGPAYKQFQSDHDVNAFIRAVQVAGYAGNHTGSNDANWSSLISQLVDEINATGYTAPVKQNATGGWLDEPIFGVGLRSGQGYSFAEQGRERVSPASAAGGGSTTITVHNLVIQEASDARATGRAVMAELTALLQRHGRNSPALAWGTD